MNTVWHDLWGSGSGRVARLAPPTRILCGALLFVALLVVPVDTVSGFLFLCGLVLIWLQACHPPRKTLQAFFFFGLILFLPYFLFVPLIYWENSEAGWGSAFLIAWRVVARGQAGLLITTSALTTLGLSDLRRGLLALPLPSLVSTLAFQILRQSSELYYETQRIASAMAVRGASGYATTGWKVLASLPTVWLPRVMLRAERVADAMEIRQFCYRGSREINCPRLAAPDWVALALGGTAVVLAFGLRWGGMP